MTQARFTFQLGRTRIRDEEGAYEPEPPTSYGQIADVAARVAEWSEGKVVFVPVDEYVVMRGAYEEKLRAQADADSQSLGEGPAPVNMPPAASTSPIVDTDQPPAGLGSTENEHFGGQAFADESGAATPIPTATTEG